MSNINKRLETNEKFLRSNDYKYRITKIDNYKQSEEVNDKINKKVRVDEQNVNMMENYFTQNFSFPLEKKEIYSECINYIMSYYKNAIKNLEDIDIIDTQKKYMIDLSFFHTCVAFYKQTFNILTDRHETIDVETKNKREQIIDTCFILVSECEKFRKLNNIYSVQDFSIRLVPDSNVYIISLISDPTIKNTNIDANDKPYKTFQKIIKFDNQTVLSHIIKYLNTYKLISNSMKLNPDFNKKWFNSICVANYQAFLITMCIFSSQTIQLYKGKTHLDSMKNLIKISDTCKSLLASTPHILFKDLLSFDITFVADNEYKISVKFGLPNSPPFTNVFPQ